MEKLLCVLGLLSAEPQAEMTAFRLLGKAMEKQTSVSRWLCWSFGSTSTGQLGVKKTLFRFSQMGKIPCLKPAVGRKRCGGGGVGVRGQKPPGEDPLYPLGMVSRGQVCASEFSQEIPGCSASLSQREHLSGMGFPCAGHIWGGCPPQPAPSGAWSHPSARCLPFPLGC